jgi:hypothetical protein
LPALTATPIGKLTKDFKPVVATLLATELLELFDELETTTDDTELDVLTLDDEELTTELDDDDTGQPATTP